MQNVGVGAGVGVVAVAVAALIGMTFVLLAEVRAVHVLVNSRLTAVLDRVEVLTALLRASGIDVPTDPNP